MKKVLIRIAKTYLITNVVLGLYLLLISFFPILGDGIFCDIDGEWGRSGCQLGASIAIIPIIPLIIVFSIFISHIVKKEKALKSTRKDYILLALILLLSLPFFVITILPIFQ